MFNKQLKRNIKMVDEHINKLIEELIQTDDKDKADEIQKNIDNATELRCKLSSNKVDESYSKEIVTGLIGIAGMVLVLQHEKADIITSKAFSMATKMFRG